MPVQDIEVSHQAAVAFATKWSGQKSEKQFAQSFWSDFFRDVIGVPDLLAEGIEFERPIKNVTTGKPNFIDVLWPGVVLIEHKSAGKSLDVAETQARDYLESLLPADRPSIVVVSNFATVRIVEILKGTKFDFPLSDLSKELSRFESIISAGGQDAAKVEVAADAKATKLMADLYVEFEANGYEGHEVSVLLVRVVFLLFGDDTRMWKHDLFEKFLDHVPDPGALGGRLQMLFQTLNQPKEKRPGSLDPSLVEFPYVNGGLFAEQLQVFAFTQEMRDKLRAACDYQWSEISPAIFGAMFQTIKSKEARRELGEHYTSEANILKVIRPLFLDRYLDRLRRSWDDASELRKLEKDLGRGQYLDPAAGSGNFLVVAYRRLRDIEHKILARLVDLEGKITSATGGGFNLQVGLDGTIGLSVTLEQFHAIEYEEWPAQIARVAMFLADHQANLALEELTGLPPNRFPLTHSAAVTHGNALRTNWADICPMGDDTIILGNPPFFGARNLNDSQREDLGLVFGSAKGVSDLDYVTAWFVLASRALSGTKGRFAFVATNSITQGVQPPVLWPHLTAKHMDIDFAHRSFRWQNESKYQAAVHPVIIGLSALPKPKTRPLWSYETVTSEPVLVMVQNINAYLLDAPSVLVPLRRKPIDPSAQPLIYGSMPNDGGFLSKISADEAARIQAEDPIAAKYLRRLVGAREAINGQVRYCLWLKDADPADLNKSAEIKKRVDAVKAYRVASDRPATNKLANYSWLFGEIRHPSTEYLVIPRHSAEGRDYFPIARFSPDVITNDAVFLVPDASLRTFGLLSSRAFEVWTKGIAGRIKSDPRISATLAYNNFPFPNGKAGSEAKIATAAQGVLDARELTPDLSLAHLYEPRSMPKALRVAHEALDKAVLNAYGLRVNVSDVGLLEQLFREYAARVEGLVPIPVKKLTSKPRVSA